MSPRAKSRHTNPVWPLPIRAEGYNSLGSTSRDYPTCHGEHHGTTPIIGHNPTGPAVLGDYWPDSIWSRVCDKREGPVSDKQQCLNLPHVTTLGLKHPLPLDECKELLLELIERRSPKDTVSSP